MRMTRKWLLLVILIGMLWLVPATLAQTTIIVTPEEGEIGTAFQVLATDLTPNSTYDVEFIYADDDVVVFTTTRQSDADGTLTLNIFSEESDPPGHYEVSILDNGDVVGTGTFVLLGADDASEPDTDTEEDDTPSPEQPQSGSVEVRMVPRNAPVGSTHDIFITGLEPEQDITVTIVSDVTGEEAYNREFEATDSGRVDVEIFSTEDDDPGTYTLNVFDEDGALLGSIGFTLEELSGRNGTLDINPETANPGETQTITITDVRPFVDFSIRVRHIDTNETIFEGTARANAEGIVTLDFTSAANATVGEYDVIVTEIESRVQVATGQITLSDIEQGQQQAVPSATMTIEPASASLGEPFDVQINNLVPDSAFTLEVVAEETGETAYSMERTADAFGAFTLALTINDDNTAGTYLITASQNGIVVAEGRIDITEAEATDTQPDEQAAEGDVSVSVDPTGGEIGTNYTISISGLSADETVDVDIRFDGESIFTTQTTADAEGNATVSVRSDETDTIGQYEVVVMRDGSDLADADFAIGEDLAASGEDTDEPEEAAEAEPFDGVIEVSPESGPRTSSFDVAIEGLNANETVTIEVTLGATPVYTTEKTADAEGNVSFTLTTSETDAAGVYTVSILRPAGEALQSVGSDVFTVTRDTAAPEATPEQTPEVTPNESEVGVNITPESGPVGTSHAVLIDGLDIGETVTLDVVYEGDVVYSTELTADDGGFATIDLVTEETDPSGVYTIRISRDGEPIGTGEITVTGDSDSIDASPQDENNSQNDDGQAATAIEGRLSAAHPEDRYFFEGNEGEAVYITLRSDDFDSYLILQDDMGSTLATNDDSGDGYHSAIGPYILPYSGQYTVISTTYDYYSYSEVTGGDFTLTIDQAPLDNIRFDTPVSATFEPGDTALFYRVDVEAGESLHIQVEGDGGIDTRLQIHDPNGVIVAQDDDSGSGFDPEIARYLVDRSGTYIVSLHPYSLSESGNVTVTVTREEARSLTDSSATITLSAKQNRDLVSVSAAADETVNIAVEQTSGSLGEVTINVLQNGATLSTYYGATLPDNLTLSFISEGESPITISIEAYTGTGTLELSISE